MVRTLVQSSNPLSISSWDDYERVYRKSLQDPDGFWSAVAGAQISWHKKWDRVSACDYSTGKVNWFLGAELNVTENCLDRHVASGRGDHCALRWIGNEPEEQKNFTFKELLAEVCKVANALEASGIKKGDRVVFYLPSIPELAIGVLACARIGAIHSVIFGGFSAQSIQNRVVDCGAKIILTANGVHRGTQWIPLKANVDAALELGCPSVEKVIVYSRSAEQGCTMGSKDLDWHAWVRGHSTQHLAKAHSAQDPLFILYTSGSTGKPKGVLHTMGGYLTYVSYTYQIVFAPKPDDVFWCTADMGWITGHSYLLYGPLSNGITTVMYEGIPTYPDPGRFWKEVERHKVSIFYTAPTAIRILAAAGDQYVREHKRSTIKTLGTVGEPINPEAWKWYHHIVGEDRAPIVDTWWQTETGGILISALAGVSPTTPGCAGYPLPGIAPAVLSGEGTEVKTSPAEGALVIKHSWPGQMVGVYGEPERFYKTYFTQYPGYYFSGDACQRDEKLQYRIIGRTDDVIKVSGHRLGTAEIESACILNPAVVESAAVGISDPVTGEALALFVVLKSGNSPSDQLKQDLTLLVRKEVGALATLKKVLFVPGLPKTRSGKIMRRILKKIAVGQTTDLGDLSTLADPGVVKSIVSSVSSASSP